MEEFPFESLFKYIFVAKFHYERTLIFKKLPYFRSFRRRKIELHLDPRFFNQINLLEAKRLGTLSIIPIIRPL